MKTLLFILSAALIGGCAQHKPATTAPHPYGNDGLPSAEVTAFQAADARLKYRKARIEYDHKGCARYQGVAPDGQIRSEQLLDARSQPICAKNL
ncbi:hypothetical protein AL065_08695 [Pseudomonas amygdali pv. ulmi]|uniref:hypothetical protein n=1 Tax=Pseudomonas syringae group TaxID=136849 RepID=UPI00070D6A96|nr:MULTISPECIES: hypothetical protein [Pseudomonas syringae group]KWS07277.1 hypothetical protein AL065_08695 [Pseudomonas amygdali pv. ulmi]MDU8500275.1 hypothetical protein [Pseudomonas syringae]PBP72045.1 hypothetical protein CCL21_06625 [Pseudomonas syringae]